MYRGSRPFPYVFARLSRMRALGIDQPPSAGAARSLSDAQNVDKTFRRAVEFLANPSSKPQNAVSNDDKLRLYALFKQGEQGPCEGGRPGMFDPVGRAKYDAWKSLGNMSREDAKRQYVEQVTRLLGALPLPATDNSGSSNTHTPAPATNSTPSTAPATTPAYPVVPSLRELMSWRSSSGSAALPSGSVGSAAGSAAGNTATASSTPQQVNFAYRHLKVFVDEHGVGNIVLSREKRANAFNVEMWGELKDAVARLGNEPSCRVVLLYGQGRHFSTGMDVSVFTELLALYQADQQAGEAGEGGAGGCEGRRRERMGVFITYLQACVTALQQCPLPVIAAIGGNCIGGAIDLICAADIRYASADAQFCVKEVDLAIVSFRSVL